MVSCSFYVAHVPYKFCTLWLKLHMIHKMWIEDYEVKSSVISVKVNIQVSCLGRIFKHGFLPCYFTNSYEVLALHLCVGQALNNFRTAIVSSDDVLRQWRPEDPDPCRWKGVKCDPKSKRVTSL